MDQLYSVAAAYDRDFMQLNGKVSLRGFKVASAVTSGLLFISSAVWMVCLLLSFTDEVELYYGVIFTTLFFEAMMLFSLYHLHRERDKGTLEALNRLFGTNYSNIDSLKREWINRSFGCKENEYFELAERIEKVRALIKKHGSAFEFSLDKASERIYNPDAKTRILTLLVLFASTIAALSVREGAGISQVLAFYGPAPWWLIGVVFISVIVFSIVSYAAIKALFQISYLVLSKASDSFAGRKAKSNRQVDNLVRDLIKLSRFERVRFQTPRSQ